MKVHSPPTPGAPKPGTEAQMQGRRHVDRGPTWARILDLASRADLRPGCREGRKPRAFSIWGLLEGVVAIAALTVCVVPPAPAAEGTLPLERAAALRAEGRLDEALDVLRAESRDVKRVAGEESLRLLPINDLAAEILVDQGSLEAAGALLTKVIATRQRLVDEGRSMYEGELAASYNTLARMHVAAKRFADAVDSARRALLIQDRAPKRSEGDIVATRAFLESALDSFATFVGPSDRKVIDTRQTAASTFESLGMFTAAIDQRRKIVDALQDAEDGAGAESFGAIDRLCRLLMMTGRADEAIPIAAAAVAEDLKSTPATPPLGNRRLLAELQLANGQLLDAKASLEAVSESLEATKAAPARDLVENHLLRLLIDVRRDRVDGLPPWLEPDLRSLAVANPADRAASARVMAVAARVLLELDLPTRAADLLSTALTTARGAKEPSAVAIADLAGQLAVATLADDDPKAAQATTSAALREAEKSLGSGDARVALLRVMLADSMRRGNDPKAAIETLGKALERELPRPDDPWEDVVVGVVDRAAAAAPEAELRERYVASRTRQFGKDHRHVGMAWSMFGTARLAAGDHTTAIACLTNALDRLKSTLGDDHPEVAATQVLLAHAERMAGDPDRAVSSAAAATDTWTRLVGNDHPGTLASTDVLVRARIEAGQTDGVDGLLERLCAAGTLFPPVQRADHLVHLASLVFPQDAARSRACLAQALELPCWRPDAEVRPQDFAPLALMAARAARVFTLLGEPARSQDTLRQARSWAMQAKDSQLLLDAVEQLAESDGPPGDR